MCIKGFFVFFSFIIFAISIGSCSKNTDTESPVITVSNPVKFDTLLLLSGGINIKFSARDNETINEVFVKVTNNAGLPIYAETKAVHSEKFSYNKYFMPAGISTVTPLILKVDATDHSGNTASNSIKFYVKP